MKLLSNLNKSIKRISLKHQLLELLRLLVDNSLRFQDINHDVLPVFEYSFLLSPLNIDYSHFLNFDFVFWAEVPLGMDSLKPGKAFLQEF